MRLTLKQIAESSGVSMTTVSRVLNGKANVSQTTIQKVRDAIRALGGSGSNGHKQGERTGLVGFLVPEATQYQGLETPIILSEIAGAKPVLESCGYALLVGTYPSEASRDDDDVMGKMVRGGELAGALVSRVRAGDQDIRPLRESGTPFVLLNARAEQDSALSVGVNNVEVGYLATRHLIERGHARIGFIGGPTVFRSVTGRFDGYRRALSEASLPYEERRHVATDLTEESGGDAARRLLTQDARPTAIVAINDYLAVGALKAAQSMGISVPEELAIIGCDDIDMTRYTTPSLSTVRIPWDAMASMAAHVLIQAMDTKNVAKCQIELDVELVPRDST